MEKPVFPNSTHINDTKIILVTGANGFVGHHVAIQLAKLQNHEIRICIRREQQHNFPENIKIFSNLDLVEIYKNNAKCYEDLVNLNYDAFKLDDLDIALDKVDCIIHCAARVHVLHEKSQDPLTEFREVNVNATLTLAKKAIANKVKRFIYISTIKVNGENSAINKPFTADDEVNPSDPYAISKMEAEQALMNLVKTHEMEVVIIRPPLIYGPMVKANFKAIINLINLHIPLPFKNIKNKRSLLAIDNLIDFIKLCIMHPKAANQIFLVSDGQDLSTTELLLKISKALNKNIFWLPIPLWFLKFFAKILRKYKVYNKLTDNLQIDINKNKELIGWKPLINIDKVLKKTINAFQQ